MSSTSEARLDEARFELALRIGDNGLILSHRLAQWSGKAHSLEEDIALTNIGLDLLGQARNWLTLAGEIEGKGRDEDRLAFFRDEGEFRNLTLVELPNGDFAQTMMRQLLFTAFQDLLMGSLSESTDERFRALARKAAKETAYHVRHSSSWVTWLADGGEESRTRIESALADCWPHCATMFHSDGGDELLALEGIAPDPGTLQSPWLDRISDLFAPLDLGVMPLREPLGGWTGQQGRHTENLGYILTEMQSLPRQFPDSRW